GVDEDRIRARYDNGVLEVTIEGAAAVREPRRIQIEGAAGESPGAPRIGTEGPGTEGTRPESPGGATGPGAEGTRPPESPGGTVR
ncbi:MAG: HSP20 family small heat-shock protein, partial [Actinomycetota bacterium]|nr:HSP20 family small heat-shock protein [Actinomycetota bacterium]